MPGPYDPTMAGGGMPQTPAQQAGPMLAGMMQGIPPALLEMLRARFMNPGAPPPVPGAGGAPQPAALPGGASPGIPGALMPQQPGGASPDQVAAGAGAMPTPSFIDTLTRMQQMRSATDVKPTDPSFVRSMKSLLAKGMISQDKFDALINDPAQFESEARR